MAPHSNLASRPRRRPPEDTDDARDPGRREEIASSADRPSRWSGREARRAAAPPQLRDRPDRKSASPPARPPPFLRHSNPWEKSLRQEKPAHNGRVHAFESLKGRGGRFRKNPSVAGRFSGPSGGRSRSGRSFRAPANQGRVFHRAAPSGHAHLNTVKRRAAPPQLADRSGSRRSRPKYSERMNTWPRKY